MRNTFARELTRLAAEDPRVVCLSGDIGNRLFDELKQVAPGRFLNSGVAEASMTGTAAGLAAMGLRPVTYTITAFATVRCLEQIRVDLCYPRLPVVIVGTGSGLSYAELGPTHHSCEEVGLLRTLPNMTVVCPCDPVEVRLALRAALRHDGPVYLRLGKKGEPRLHAGEPDFQLGKALTLRPGDDACLLATGGAVGLALEAAAALEARGVSARVESVHTVKPLDEGLLQGLAGRCPVVATVEEHSRIGGLGGAVAEWAADHQAPFRLLRFGTDDRFLGQVGTQEWARQALGLTAAGVVAGVAAALDRPGPTAVRAGGRP
ncbi:MAG: transketolase C-terminal domain-containing protein [Anaeromyxobacter sp.]